MRLQNPSIGQSENALDDAVRAFAGTEDCGSILSSERRKGESPAQPGSAKDCPSDIQRVVWIASYPKSGNTWVRVFIHNLYRELRGTGGAQSINSLSELTARESQASEFARQLGKHISRASATEIARARAAVQASIARDREGDVFIKTHNAVANVDGFPTINFDITLAAIYIVRNPLDVAVSYARYSGLPIDPIISRMATPPGHVEAKADRVYEFVGPWSFHAASWMSVPNRPVLVLRYEDMLSDPPRTFGRLAAFLGLKASDSQLKRAIESSSFEEMVRQEEASGFVERPASAHRFFREGRMGQWRKTLSPLQVETVVRSHGPMMMRFGYLPERCGRQLAI